MSDWHGDKTNGIEIRRNDDGSIDEICLYVEGKCVVHVEQMSDQCFWMALHAANHTAHINFQSKNRRSYVEATAEAWCEHDERNTSPASPAGGAKSEKEKE